MKYIFLGIIAAALCIGYYKHITNKPTVDVVLAEYKMEVKAYEADKQKQAIAAEMNKKHLEHVDAIIAEFGTDKLEVKRAIVEKFLPFGDGNARMALLIAKMESKFRLDAQGYNCEYQVMGIKKSTVCAPEDRDKAWSVDCGIFQINQPGLVCPPELFTLDGNLNAALGKFLRRNNTWFAWTTYNNLFN